MLRYMHDTRTFEHDLVTDLPVVDSKGNGEHKSVWNKLNSQCALPNLRCVGALCSGDQEESGAEERRRGVQIG